jgi:orotate phosphoribosyltransferase
VSAERGLLLPEEDQLRLAVELHSRGLFGIFEDPSEAIKLKSERLSPHYLDIRKGISSFSMRQIVGQSMLMLTTLRNESGPNLYLGNVYDHLAGTPEAMTSYAATIADLAKMSLLQPRVATNKAVGNKTPILGQYEDGDEVAAYDDVVTEGQSKIDTVEAFKEAGLLVTDYYVVLDREEGGAPHVELATGIKVTPALGVSSMTRLLKAERRISVQQYDNVARYLDQYGEPHAQETISRAI